MTALAEIPLSEMPGIMIRNWFHANVVALKYVCSKYCIIASAKTPMKQAADTEIKSEISQHSSVKIIAVTGASLLAVFLLFFITGLTKGDSIAGITKADSKDFLIDEEPQMSPRLQYCSLVLLDSMKPVVPVRVFINDISATDTSIVRVLLFGDSQVEFLRLPVYNYCKNNNCALVASIVWYGSTTIAWADGDTLNKYLELYKPDFVFCALGLNEVVVSNVEPRRKYIHSITETIKAFGAQYYWIGPAAWEKDWGITTVMNEELGDSLFYPSHNLVLDRGPDKRHPSWDASKIWFDSVAVAVTRDTRLNLGKTVSHYEEPQHSPFIPVEGKH